MKSRFSLLLFFVFTTAMKLPDNFSCSGTEPFWGFRKTPKGATFDLMGAETPTVLTAEGLIVSGYHGMSDAAGFVARGKLKDGKRFTLTYVPAPSCSDGMSERKYQGYGVFDMAGKTAYYGCCVPAGKAP